MFYEFRPQEAIQSPTGTSLTCKTWDSEAALRMLMNNLDPRIATQPDELIVYGGAGRAVRNWREYQRVINTLKTLEKDETLCIQSGKPVYVAKTHENAPRLIIANANLVPAWAKQEVFDTYEEMGITMYGQTSAGSWTYAGIQDALASTYETFAMLAKKAFQSETLKGKLVLTSGMGGMSGAQPLAVTMNEGVILCVEVRKERIERKLNDGYCDKMTANLDEALKWALDAKSKQIPLSIGLIGNAADVYPELINRQITPDVVTDQTPAHDLTSYVPIGDVKELDKLKEKNKHAYKEKVLDAIVEHAKAILTMQRNGAVCFEYGNNLRAQAEMAGVSIRDADGRYWYQGFMSAFLRPLFLQGKAPFKWVALSGSASDIEEIDNAIIKDFDKDASVAKWLRLVREKKTPPGLPARSCWLSYNDCAKTGRIINDLVKNGTVKAPVVICRDHFDSGSAASPYQETEDMMDGSDAVADWPMINLALNTANGATWVGIQQGGGAGIGNSLYSSMAIVADGTMERGEKLERVLTMDTGIGIARRFDAGYGEAMPCIPLPQPLPGVPVFAGRKSGVM